MEEALRGTAASEDLACGLPLRSRPQVGSTTPLAASCLPMTAYGGQQGGSLRTIVAVAPAEFILFYAFLAAVSAGLVVAWIAWWRQDPPKRAPRWRRAMHLSGLATASAAVLCFGGFVLHARAIGGFANDPWAGVLWVRAGFWLSAIALVSAGLGRGNRRWVLLLCAAATTLLWMGVAMAP